MVRSIFLIVLILTILHLPLWMSVPLVVVYSFYYRGLELLILAGCIDVYYGGEIGFPYYVFGTTLIILVVEYFRPSINLKDAVSS